MVCAPLITEKPRSFSRLRPLPYYHSWLDLFAQRSHSIIQVQEIFWLVANVCRMEEFTSVLWPRKVRMFFSYNAFPCGYGAHKSYKLDQPEIGYARLGDLGTALNRFQFDVHLFISLRSV